MAMAEISGRALHYVLKIGDRAKNAFFFRKILGMQVLRHEEFKTGCEAECNGPYDNRWSKTMIGYGPESGHFVLELTYNYGVKSYELGNDLAGITIVSQESLERARSHNYPITKERDCNVLVSPDGYKFYIVNEAQPQGPEMDDPIIMVGLHCANLTACKDYWVNLLNMKEISSTDTCLLLEYAPKQARLRLSLLSEPLDRKAAYGRIAFAVPNRMLDVINVRITEANGKILTPLITLDTPGKASVRVIILADPNGHEICFVEEEGFAKLSQVEANADAMLERYLAKDPFQNKE